MWAMGKEDQIAGELARMANLRQDGQLMKFPIENGNFELEKFSGYMRAEKDWYWSKRIVKHLTLDIQSFSERDTVKGTRELNSEGNQRVEGVPIWSYQSGCSKES